MREHYKAYLFVKQDGKCALCYQTVEFKNSNIDHIQPRSRGGANHLSNMQLTHKSCNTIKADGLPNQPVASCMKCRKVIYGEDKINWHRLHGHKIWKQRKTIEPRKS